MLPTLSIPADADTAVAESFTIPSAGASPAEVHFALSDDVLAPATAQREVVTPAYTSPDSAGGPDHDIERGEMPRQGTAPSLPANPVLPPSFPLSAADMVRVETTRQALHDEPHETSRLTDPAPRSGLAVDSEPSPGAERLSSPSGPLNPSASPIEVPLSPQILQEPAEAAEKEKNPPSPLPPLPPVKDLPPENNLSPDPEIAERQLTEAHARAAIVERAAQLRQASVLAGDPVPIAGAIARRLGVPESNLRRYERAFAERGFAGLIPQWHKSGRKAETERLRGILGEKLYASVMSALAGVTADTEAVTSGARWGSKMELGKSLAKDHTPEEITLAKETMARFLDHTAEGPARRSKHSLPPSFRRELAPATSKPVQDYHRGPRRFAVKGFSVPRANDLLPGDLITSDDTTPIVGCAVPCPWAKGNPLFARDTCEYRFGESVMQGQYLPIIDVASQAILVSALIMRATSGYRASDIWGLLGQFFDCYGLPRLGVQFERGSWEAILIEGKDVEFAEGEVSLIRRVGGLRMLPTQITDWHRAKHGPDWCAAFPKTLLTQKCYSPNTKSIEAWFDRSQIYEGTLWGVMGRDQMRRPYEATKKLFGACARGAAQPSLHFRWASELAEQYRRVGQFLNEEPIEGRVFNGVPGKKFLEAVGKYPLMGLPEDQRHIYRRHWSIVTIRRGFAAVRADMPDGTKATLHYTHPRAFAQYEGQSVICYYDAAAPEVAAQIHDARTGEYLCDAEYFAPVGMIGDAEKDGNALKKMYRETVATYYHAHIAATAPSRQLPAEIAARRVLAHGHHVHPDEKPETRNQKLSPGEATQKPTPSAFRRALMADED